MKHWVTWVNGIGLTGATLAVTSIAAIDSYIRITAGLLGCILTSITIAIQIRRWFRER